MNSGVYIASKDKKPIILTYQQKFQAEIGYVAARQKAIELAMVVDEDCYELGIDRSPTGVASWNDDRRPPLFWAGSDHPVDCGTVLMYECRHFYEDDCEQLPTTLRTIPELIMNAHEAYQHILSVKFQSFEHVGSPPPTDKFLIQNTWSSLKNLVFQPVCLVDQPRNFRFHQKLGFQPKNLADKVGGKMVVSQLFVGNQPSFLVATACIYLHEATVQGPSAGPVQAQMSMHVAWPLEKIWHTQAMQDCMTTWGALLQDPTSACHNASFHMNALPLVKTTLLSRFCKHGRHCQQ